MATEPHFLNPRIGRNARQRPSDVELGLFRIELIKRNLKLRDLTAKTGLSLKTLRNIQGGAASQAGRAAINRALGVQIFSIK